MTSGLVHPSMKPTGVVMSGRRLEFVRLFASTPVHLFASTGPRNPTMKRGKGDKTEEWWPRVSEDQKPAQHQVRRATFVCFFRCPEVLVGPDMYTCVNQDLKIDRLALSPWDNCSVWKDMKRNKSSALSIRSAMSLPSVYRLFLQSSSMKFPLK